MAVAFPILAFQMFGLCSQHCNGVWSAGKAPVVDVNLFDQCTVQYTTRRMSQRIAATMYLAACYGVEPQSIPRGAGVWTHMEVGSRAGSGEQNVEARHLCSALVSIEASWSQP